MLRKMSYDQWAEHLSQTHGRPDYSSWMGCSPGWAAEDLGVTRQRIWQMVREGKLDMLMMGDGDGTKPSCWIITEASLARYKKSKPGVQQDLLSSISKRKKGRR
jgi:hypothetical protein